MAAALMAAVDGPSLRGLSDYVVSQPVSPAGQVSRPSRFGGAARSSIALNEKQLRKFSTVFGQMRRRHRLQLESALSFPPLQHNLLARTAWPTRYAQFAPSPISHDRGLPRPSPKLHPL